MAFVYWIHLPEHDDMFTQGYIGVTDKTVSARFSQHKGHAKKGVDYPIYRAMRKYGERLVVDTIVDAPLDYCYSLEYQLRPNFGIGYNSACGGETPSMRGLRHSDETKRKISEAFKGEKHPLYGKPVPDERKLKMSLSQLGSKSKAFGKPRSEEDRAKMREAFATNGHPNTGKSSWRLPKARGEVWCLACAAYDFYTAAMCGVRKLSKHFNSTDSAFQKLYNKIKSGWNPYEDVEYQEWLSNYKIKECYGT